MFYYPYETRGIGGWNAGETVFQRLWHAQFVRYRKAYKLGTKDQIRDTAQTLRSLIKKAFSESKEMPWPPTPDEVGEIKPSEQLPGELIRFLNLLLSGGECTDDEQMSRVVVSVAQDLCRAATNAEWKLPKHVFEPITANETVAEFLDRTEAATDEVGQEHVVSTFDLGVVMKACPIIWKFMKRYKRHIILIGPFHTGFNFAGRITGCKMHGAGYADILIEAKLVTSASLKCVLSGKNWALAIWCLRTITEAAERLLVEIFIEEEGIEINMLALFNLIEQMNRDAALNDEPTKDVIQAYLNFQDKVKKGHLGKTGVLWMSFLDNSHVLLMLLFAVKTNNVPLFHKCNSEMADLFFAYDGQNYARLPSRAMFIQDGNALFHTLTNLPHTYGEICLQVLDNMVAKQNFIFSTDNYEHESIKAQERLRHGFGERCIIAGPQTVRAPEFKLFLANEDNKKQLCQLLYKVWTSAVSAGRLARCGTAILSVEGLAHSLSAADGENIKLTVYIDIGTGRGRQLVNVSQLATDLGPEYCDTLLGYYVFSGEDCTSSFKGKGKVSPLKKLQKNPKYQAAFRELVVEWCLSDSCKEVLESFTCLMYGHGRESKVDAVRVKMIRKMVGEDQSLSAKSNVDLGRLPPPQCCLSTHLDCCNHRVAGYKPKPYDPDQEEVKEADNIEDENNEEEEEQDETIEDDLNDDEDY
ncbi:hypothetical protein SKAU_G00415580 [Synaphobranchus kaupii]|uniref:Uncharacterized protein n=1 Tax=Synaphobranchus kaupii TaxID=118154 RepID=A0A9Q1E7F3_SYNKA|nr:hypothetical protein SKAU_G00415580 [Synaphobranchus kaupii]